MGNTETAKSFHDVAPLDRAAHSDVSFLDNIKYLDSFSFSQAGACFVREKNVAHAPKTMSLLVVDDPYHAYARMAQRFYPAERRSAGIHPSVQIPASARIGANVRIEQGAYLAENVIIGDECEIHANCVIGHGVEIGSGTVIGSCSTLSHCTVGSQVIIHRGVHVGQDGFGFALSREGHVKVPQLGRVIIEDDVEIGSGTCIDRGSGPDTVIGAGTKIDNQVQIGHNVILGRGVVIAAQTGISGSTRVGDGVIFGGQCGIAGHLKIGAGARFAARSGLMNDVPAGASYGGAPALPINEWRRQMVAFMRLGKKKGDKDD